MSIGTIDPASERRVLQLVGLARRAGRAMAGTQAVRDALHRGEVHLVLLAGDATDNAERRVAGAAARAAVPLLRCGTRETLGLAVGRSGSVVVGIGDAGLAGRIAEVRRSS